MLFTDGFKTIDITVYQDCTFDETARPIDITADFVREDLSKKVYNDNADEAVIVEDVDALIDWINDRISEENEESENYEYSAVFAEADFEAVLDKDEPNEDVVKNYRALRAQIARKKKNARQREYEKKTGYAAIIKCQKETTRQISLRFSKSSDSAILAKLDSVDNKNDYIRQLILNDINK